jgi:hypothetical protein
MKHRRSGNHSRPTGRKANIFHRTVVALLLWGTLLLVLIGVAGATATHR